MSLAETRIFSALAAFLIMMSACLMPPPVAAQAASPPEPTIDVARYSVEGDNPLGDGKTQAILAPLAGTARTLAQIEAAAAELEKALHAQGYAFHRVIVPAQKPKEGVIVLRVVAFPLAEMRVEGNEHFSAENIRRSLPAMKAGEPVNLEVLGSDISTANTNPAKQVSVTFRESRQPQAVDAVVKVKDIDPVSVFAGLNANRVVDPLHGEPAFNNFYRMTFGLQHANLFDRDHVVTASVTTDPTDVSSVLIYGAYYQLPIYDTGLSLSGAYTYSSVSSGRVQQGGGFFDVSGRGDFLGLKLTKSLPRIGTVHQSISVGLDNRFFKNSTTFAGGAQVRPDVASRPLTLRYALSDEQAWGGFSGYAEYASNLHGGAGNSPDRYRDNGADFGWSAWRYGADLKLNEGAWQFTARLRGQSSQNSLIAGEQFGLGGSNSVRGFAEREVLGDYGYSWNLEASGPSILAPHLRPVLFIDGGSAHARAADHTERLLSAGPGLRWSTRDADLSVDIAHAFDRNDQAVEKPGTRLHFSLIYRF